LAHVAKAPSIAAKESKCFLEDYIIKIKKRENAEILCIMLLRASGLTVNSTLPPPPPKKKKKKREEKNCEA